MAAEALSRAELMADTTGVDPFSYASNSPDNSLPSREEQEEATDGTESGRTDDLLPTDWASLERREAQIAGAPLEDLLDKMGASLRDDDTAPPKKASQSENIASDELSNLNKAVDTEPPTTTRLNRLARLNDLEREMNERGGPGRLAYDEVEHIVVANGRSELRGIVKSWLEWASF